TDGVTEATDAHDELYGEERLLNLLNSRDFRDVKELCDAVKADVDLFVGEAPQFDDITMVALRYDGPETNGRIKLMKEITVDAKIDSMNEVLAFVDAELEALDCPMKAQAQIDVAIDELFSNIAFYAYHPDTGPATVRVEVEEDPLAVIITFLDNGMPYDPLSAKEPDTTLSAEDRPVGGLGVLIVKKSMDDVSYEYKDGQNILKIKKNL
ncbi:MAG: ATP-binding protein, partial [Firmicutes bacterium]|nr:ATP-binding protein [Bacillota bacterium]